MNTQILFFGSLADRLGRRVELDLPEAGCTIAELRRRLTETGESFAAVLREPGIRASADQQLVHDDQRVLPGQEISFFPILSGG